MAKGGGCLLGVGQVGSDLFFIRVWLFRIDSDKPRLEDAASASIVAVEDCPFIVESDEDDFFILSNSYHLP